MKFSHLNTAIACIPQAIVVNTYHYMVYRLYHDFLIK